MNYQLSLSIILLFFSSTLLANNPEEGLSLISADGVEVNLIEEEQQDFFRLAEFNSQTKSLNFVTKDYVTFVQIYDEEGLLKFQIPVMSNKLRINPSVLESGDYKLAFVTKNNTAIQYTNLSIN